MYVCVYVCMCVCVYVCMCVCVYVCVCVCVCNDITLQEHYAPSPPPCGLAEKRQPESSSTLLLSRHLGRLRNGLHPFPPGAAPADGTSSTPHTPIQFQNAGQLELAVRASGLPTRTLPVSREFDPVWQFVDAHVPAAARGFFLERDSPAPPSAGASPALHGGLESDAAGGGHTEGGADGKLPPLAVVGLNHVSIETTNVARLRAFYTEVVGLRELPRPDFGFGGAWLALSASVALHIIERDPLKPEV